MSDTNCKVSGLAACWLCLHTGLPQQCVSVCVCIYYTMDMADQAWVAGVESMPCTCTAEQSDMIGWKQPHKPGLNTNGCDPRQVQEVTVHVAQCGRGVVVCVCVSRFVVWPAYVASSFPRPAIVKWVCCNLLASLKHCVGSCRSLTVQPPFGS